MIARGLEKAKMGTDCQMGGRVILRDEENVLDIDSGDRCITL